MDSTREPNATPAYLRPGTGDHAAGMSLVAGILAALRVRDRTGKGQDVDVSLLQIGLYIQGNDLAMTLVTGKSPIRHDRCAPTNPLWNQYPVKGGRWLFLVMIESAKLASEEKQASAKAPWLSAMWLNLSEKSKKISEINVGAKGVLFSNTRLSQ